jgi:lactate dehydrogenase-like 2-hydroxyacid dehydrogenase
MSDKIEILAMATIPVRLIDAVGRRFTLHDRLGIDDPLKIEEGVRQSVRGVVTTGKAKFDAERLALFPKLEIISSYSAGLENIDLDACAAKGVTVTNSSEALAAEVADTAMFLVLDAARRYSAADRYTRAGKWTKGAFPITTSVGGKKMGIVGLGRIGKALARRAEAFGMTVRYTGRTKQADVSYPFEATIKDLAGWSDFLVLCLPGGKETYRVVDAPVLQALGAKGYLVNIARGSVVDEPALIQALKSGTIAGAGLDVFEDEPRVPPVMFDFDNAVLLPHMASGSHETRAAMARAAYDNLCQFFKVEGEKLSDQDLDTTVKRA